jgi:hypothetical protein
MALPFLIYAPRDTGECEEGRKPIHECGRGGKDNYSGLTHLTETLDGYPTPLLNA